MQRYVRHLWLVDTMELIGPLLYTRGVATKFCFGGTDSWASKPTYPQKNSFSSDFGHFTPEMLENAKFTNVSRKKYWNIIISGETSPLIFRLRGRVPRPPPPAFDAHVRYIPTCTYQVSTQSAQPLPSSSKRDICDSVTEVARATCPRLWISSLYANVNN